MLIADFISTQPIERQQLLAQLHAIILQNDVSVEATVEKMMGKEIITFKCKGNFKYGLGSMKAYMSLHIMPIYASPVLFSKYQKLLPYAKFQKGCINFTDESQLSIEVVKQLFTECAKMDLAAIREAYMKSKAKK